MADGPASARERAEAREERPRRFPHLKPLSEEEYAAQHADAIWSDIRSTHYGRAELRHHGQRINGRLAWRFPYADRVYVVYRPTRHANRWAVALWLAPYSDEREGLPRDAVTAMPKHGLPLVSGEPTIEGAVKALALQLVGSKCDHGYTRGKDSCPGCDVLDDEYDDLP